MISRSGSSPARSARFSGLLTLAVIAASGLLAQPSPQPPFVDRTADSGLDFVHFNGMSGEFYFPEMMGPGGALLDYDNDGDLDLYLVQGTILGPGKALDAALFPPRHAGPLTDRLYRNDLVIEDDGTRRLRFTDVSARSGLTAGAYGMGVATGDYDNDGFIDIYVTSFGANRLLRNQGDGTFADVTEAAGAADSRWSVGATFFDYDRDGWLDLYVGNYVDFRMVPLKRCRSTTGRLDYCSPQAYRGEPDRLLRNLGDGRFEDVSGASGIGAVPGPGLGGVAADFNGDDWPDLYVSNDGVANRLWINQRDGRFSDEALLGGCAVNREGKPEASMGVGAGDVDGDGDMDLFMTHLHRETNTLFVNDGKGLFRDATLSSGLGAPSLRYTGFGAVWMDYDNDGRLDLLVVNGAVKTLEAQAAAGSAFPLAEPDQLFRNRGEGAFEDVSASVPALGVPAVSRGAIVGDVDNDGDPDVVIVDNNGPARLLINGLGQQHSWLGLRLLDAAGGRDALGARAAVVLPDGGTLWRRAGTDGSYASAHDARVLFGLGGHGRDESGRGALSVRVVWPDGTQESWREVPRRAYTTLTRGSGKPTPGGATDRESAKTKRDSGDPER